MLMQLSEKTTLIRCVCVFIMSLHACGSNRVKRGYCSTRNLAIKNGDYRFRSGNSVVEFTCNKDFTLYGVERIVCFTSKWSDDPPICISNTCQPIQPTTTLRIETEYEGALLKFSCAVMFKLDGQEQLICDGTNWNGPAPSCQAWSPPVTCDFEDPEICGWSHDDKDDQDWRWNTGKTATSRTGPSHDHTLGGVGNGHYMYFETSSPTRTNHKAILKSPLYPAQYARQKCFIFWYHIFGEGDISDLEVFIRPESIEDLSKLDRIFHVNTNGGDVWYEESIQVPMQSEPFQVLLVATRGTNYRSDIAIDDVALGECSGTLPPVYMTTTTTTENVTSEPLTTTIRTTTTQPPPSTTTRTSTTTQTAPPPTTTTIGTTKAPVTTSKKTEIVTTPTTVTTQKSTSSTTVRISKTTEKTTAMQTNAVNSTTSASKTTLKPIVNPNVPSSKKHIPGETRDGPSVVWIVLGVAIVLVIAVAIIIAIYWYRRKQNRSRKQCSLSSTNPLYNVINGDEAAVHFASDDANDF